MQFLVLLNLFCNHFLFVRDLLVWVKTDGRLYMNPSLKVALAPPHKKSYTRCGICTRESLWAAFNNGSDPFLGIRNRFGEILTVLGHAYSVDYFTKNWCNYFCCRLQPEFHLARLVTKDSFIVLDRAYTLKSFFCYARWKTLSTIWAWRDVTTQVEFWLIEGGGGGRRPITRPPRSEVFNRSNVRLVHGCLTLRSAFKQPAAIRGWKTDLLLFETVEYSSTLLRRSIFSRPFTLTVRCVSYSV